MSVIKASLVIDPKHWNLTDKSYGEGDLNILCDHFATPLELLGLERSKLKAEWKSFKRLVSNWYSKHDVHALWPKIFNFRKMEFPNLCKLVSVIMCISVSNSTVERGFSALTVVLDNRRLILSHKSIEALLLIKINNHSWSDAERSELIDAAVKLYLSKRRVKRLQSTSAGRSVSSTVVDNSAADSDANCDSGTDNCSDDDTVSSESETESVSDLVAVSESVSDFEAVSELRVSLIL